MAQATPHFGRSGADRDDAQKKPDAGALLRGRALQEAFAACMAQPRPKPERARSLGGGEALVEQLRRDVEIRDAELRDLSAALGRACVEACEAEALRRKNADLVQRVRVLQSAASVPGLETRPEWPDSPRTLVPSPRPCYVAAPVPLSGLRHELVVRAPAPRLAIGARAQASLSSPPEWGPKGFSRAEAALVSSPLPAAAPPPPATASVALMHEPRAPDSARGPGVRPGQAVSVPGHSGHADFASASLAASRAIPVSPALVARSGAVALRASPMPTGVAWVRVSR
mmetsp:Transcript_56975/g.159902  ORF Transcript_56975/g.159902 Transcript_56975/m.159902 type:complete len:285 (+) Transcript_56975:76-930(+)|eukprot:CAMPEP_0176250006 /NCGR_PEP_ID=MMETSP0121_2-20121125/34264_1 /TAXON_ID=160619 /ORGANISM="Kryptoperidinium foliaceum, Strain CCMP 1326" /LENGTH=284 /DNA_ID=CAMNT_0017589711 /DNA_START=57 /DNA_END=911 /DNA_ORIENTATION=+